MRGRSSPLGYLGAVAVFAAAYYASGELGLLIESGFAGVTPLWPPSGIALFAFLAFGSRLWPGLLIGVALLARSNDIPAAAAAIGALGNLLEAFVGVHLLQHFRVATDLRRFRDVLGFIILAALAAPLVSATIGSFGMVLGGVAPAQSFPFMCLTWWLGDATGIMVFTPLLLVWRAPVDKPGWWRAAELVVLLAGLTVVACYSFGLWQEFSPFSPLLVYLIIPFAVWGGIRFGQRGATATGFLVCALLLWGTQQGQGPFDSVGEFPSLMLEIAFILVTMGTALIVAALFSERERAAALLRRANEELEARVQERTAALQQVNRNLQYSEERYRTLVEHAAEAILVCDLEQNRFIDANGNAGELFGMARNDLLSRNLIDLSVPSQTGEVSPAQCLQGFSERALQGKLCVFEWTIRNARGEDVPCEIRLVRFPCEGRRLIRYTITDITERKRAEGQLQRAKEDAEAANRTKSIFLANVSHELRTPMNGVMGFTNLLLKTGLSEVQREYVDIIKRSAGNLLAIINDLLDLSKIEADKLVIKAEPFDLRESLDDTLRMLEPAATGKDLVLSQEVDKGVPKWLSGDPVRVRQVLVNLIGNAVKFTDRGSVRARAEVLETDGDQVLLRVAVTDTGVGVRPEQLPQLFQAYGQLEAERLPHQEGTGLGLAIAKRLVELMGGEIGVESEYGRGATFWFTLRCRMVAQAPAWPDAVPAGDLAYEGVSVLVADDSPINRKLINAFLSQWGVRVEEAEDGAQAVELAGSRRYDLILMDIRMPQLGGTEAARQIRALEGDRFPTPIVALTAHALPGEQEQFIAAGMNECLTKPVDEVQLWEVVQRWVAHDKLATLRVSAG